MKRLGHKENKIIKKDNLVIPFKDAYWVHMIVTVTGHEVVIQEGFVSRIEMSIGREGVVHGSYDFNYENKEGIVLEERIMFDDDPDFTQRPMIFDNLKSAKRAQRELAKRVSRNCDEYNREFAIATRRLRRRSTVDECPF